MQARPHTVADIMTETVIVLQHDEAVGENTDDIDRFRLRQLPVLDGDRLVGLVTHRELLAAVLQRRLGDPAPVVGDIMSRDVVTVRRDTPVAEALTLLIDRKAGCLLVVDGDGTLAGIVTEYDGVKLACALLAE